MSTSILQMIRRLVDTERNRDDADEVLLQRFRCAGDESAFQTLLRRHGPLVWNICRTLLPNEEDREDAFQATFLTLARKAGSIRKRTSLSCWLHGVAYRTALKSQANFAKRRKHEARVKVKETAIPEDLTWYEAQRILHEELDRLSEHYREPLVLCYLRGLTQDEAATKLKLTRGTLKGRLERGRELLRARLLRRGLGPAAVLLVSAWPGAKAMAGISSSMASATIQAASLINAGQSLPLSLVSTRVISLLERATKASLSIRIGIPLVLVLCLAVLGLGGGMFGSQENIEGEPVLVAQVINEEKPPKKKQPNISNNLRQLVDHLKKFPVRSQPGPDQLGLFVMDLTTQKATMIAAQVDQERAYCGSPCWSADGKKIYFDVSPGQQFNKTHLRFFQMTENGLTLENLGPGNCPAASPDGKQIAFNLNSGTIPGEKPGLYLMNADGSNRYWVGESGIPKWSANGKKIMTASFSNPYRITLIDVPGGKTHSVQFPGLKVYSVPNWAGKDTIVTVVGNGKEISVALVDISNPDEGKVKENLWVRGKGLNVEPAYPIFSPETGKCIFVGREKKGQALYFFEKGKLPRPLEPGQFDGKVASLALSPDGNYLLFCSDRQ